MVLVLVLVRVLIPKESELQPVPIFSFPSPSPSPKILSNNLIAPRTLSAFSSLITPMVRCSVRRGRIARGGMCWIFEDEETVTSFLKDWREERSCGVVEGVMRGMARKCVSRG